MSIKQHHILFSPPVALITSRPRIVFNIQLVSLLYTALQRQRSIFIQGVDRSTFHYVCTKLVHYFNCANISSGFFLIFSHHSKNIGKVIAYFSFSYLEILEWSNPTDLPNPVMFFPVSPRMAFKTSFCVIVLLYFRYRKGAFTPYL